MDMCTISASDEATLHAIADGEYSGSAQAKSLLQRIDPNYEIEEEIIPPFGSSLRSTKVTSSAEAQIPLLGVFPNPATTEVYLAAQLPDGIESAYIHIYTADGKLMEVRNALDCRGLCSLNINDYANGQYTVQLIVDSRMFAIEKFTVSK